MRRFYALSLFLFTVSAASAQRSRTRGVALDLASRAAGGMDVALAGGASTARQYLGAGLVDQMEIHLVPVPLGAGERLFDGVSDLDGLHLVRTVAAPGVTHLKFVRH